MKVQNVLKNILRVVTLGGLLCMLPLFVIAVRADDSNDPIIWLSNGTTRATENTDYKIVTDKTPNRVELLENNLIIEQSKIVNGYSLTIRDNCPYEGMHTYTIKNLNMKVSATDAVALDFGNNESTSNPYPNVELYVEGNCTISGEGGGSAKGMISIGDLQILSKPGGNQDSLTISNVNEGIAMNGDEIQMSPQSLIFGDADGHSLAVNIGSSSSYALTGYSYSSKSGPLIINKGVSLNCTGTGGAIPTGEGLVDYFSIYDINGTVSFELNYTGEDTGDGRGAIKLRGGSADDFKIGPYANISLSSTGKAAIINAIPAELNKDALGVTILGSPNPHNEGPFKSTVITALNNGTPGYSVIAGTDTYAKSVIIKGSYFESMPSDNAEVIVDRDTFKSEVPARTVIATDNVGAQTFFDLKVHSADEKTVSNQKLLVQYLFGGNSKILLTDNIYPRRDLSITENGSLKLLIWNNLPKNQAGAVSAIVYNQTDGAYIINGVLDANGTAIFNGFKLRPASTITICK